MQKRAGILLIGLALCLGIVTSGGYSAAVADRGVSVAVVDDDRAYVGYDSPDQLTFNTTTDVEKDIVNVTNRFPTAIVIESVTTGSDDISVEYSTDPISPGAETTVTLVECTLADEAQTVPITVEVDGGDVSAKIDGDTETRAVEIECVS